MSAFNGRMHILRAGTNCARQDGRYDGSKRRSRVIVQREASACSGGTSHAIDAACRSKCNRTEYADLQEGATRESVGHLSR